MITQERLKELVIYDEHTGFFTRKINRRKFKEGEITAQNEKDGYFSIKLDGVKYRAHRLAWLYIHGVLPSGQIDHINGIRTDNRITNLRDVSHSINQQNQTKPRSNNKSGYLGVTHDTRANVWYARIKVNNKHKHLGTFKDAETAHQAYLKAKRELHIGCTI